MLTYAIVTPARNEADNIARLADAVVQQSLSPSAWIVVDDGSTDGTGAVIAEAASTYPWISAIDSPGPETRGGSLLAGRRLGRAEIAFQAGVGALAAPVDIVVKADADISFAADYFERLLAEFEVSPTLGIASGSELALIDGSWVQRHNVGDSVWGPARAYRWTCFHQVTPIEERLGWERIDEARAQAHGWQTRTIEGLQYRHHRPEGTRDHGSLSQWSEIGRSSWYMGYRTPYLVARTLHRARTDPAALGILFGFAKSAIRREPKISDQTVRAMIRDSQRLRDLPRRRREALGRPAKSERSHSADD